MLSLQTILATYDNMYIATCDTSIHSYTSFLSHMQPDLEDEYENSPIGVKNGYKEEHQDHEEVWQSSSFRPPKPRPRMKDSSLGSSTDNRHSLDPPTDVAELQQLLREKDAQIEQMSQQLHKTAADLTKSVRHTREQNLIIEDLREQLARKEVIMIVLLES